MTDATHEDIIRRIDHLSDRVDTVAGRVGLFEETHGFMRTELALVKQNAQAAKENTAENKKHFDEQIAILNGEMNGTKLELTKHRTEFRTGIALLVFLITVGMSALALWQNYLSHAASH